MTEKFRRPKGPGSIYERSGLVIGQYEIQTVNGKVKRKYIRGTDSIGADPTRDAVGVTTAKHPYVMADDSVLEEIQDKTRESGQRLKTLLNIMRFQRMTDAEYYRDLVTRLQNKNTPCGRCARA